MYVHEHAWVENERKRRSNDDSQISGLCVRKNAAICLLNIGKGAELERNMVNYTLIYTRKVMKYMEGDIFLIYKMLVIV